MYTSIEIICDMKRYQLGVAFFMEQVSLDDSAKPLINGRDVELVFYTHWIQHQVFQYVLDVFEKDEVFCI